jgi:hypothetical protein
MAKAKKLKEKMLKKYLDTHDYQPLKSNPTKPTSGFFVKDND